MASAGLVIIVAPGFKVYRGIPGFVDWRSHGAFTRFIKSGIYSGADSDWLHLGQPLGPVVGSVMCGGCSLPQKDLSEREWTSQCKTWIRDNRSMWDKLKFSSLRWGVSEEWQPFVELWKPLFHNEDYVDVSRLKALEEKNFYGAQKSRSA